MKGADTTAICQEIADTVLESELSDKAQAAVLACTASTIKEPKFIYARVPDRAEADDAVALWCRVVIRALERMLEGRPRT